MMKMTYWNSEKEHFQELVIGCKILQNFRIIRQVYKHCQGIFCYLLRRSLVRGTLEEMSCVATYFVVSHKKLQVPYGKKLIDLENLGVWERIWDQVFDGCVNILAFTLTEIFLEHRLTNLSKLGVPMVDKFHKLTCLLAYNSTRNIYLPLTSSSSVGILKNKYANA